MIGIFNRRFNPLYAIGERAFYAHLSANSHDWRGAFRHGTVAVVLTVLAVVTMGKGLSGALKKGSAGNGAAHAGAAEEAGAKPQTTLSLGPSAAESIPARGPTRKFTAAERSKINEIGRTQGCHTCGTQNPNTSSGNFIPDHQPPNALATPGEAQRLFPHCKNCSVRQGGEVSVIKRSMP